ncbi:MAG: hypothetical protein IJB78_04625 [Oscillospiraceae bacterium]|nr:hypothetical protein [Oscillospiraceae bacterium]
MKYLLLDYVTVSKNNISSYGGNQLWSENATLRQCGCGVIAAADLLLYLSANNIEYSKGPAKDLTSASPIPHRQYEQFTCMLKNKYLPLLPPFGMNGLSLAVGLNLYFMRWGIPLSARWGTTHKNLWERMEEMLEQDIPVIFAVGPNFPLVWKNNRLNFYSKKSDSYFKSSSAKAHFITLTGIDGDWLRISSWGKQFYISKKEFLSYSRMHSLDILSNMLYIRKK